MFIIPSIREPEDGDKAKNAHRTSWAVPIDKEHVAGISIVAWPLRTARRRLDWKPGTDTIATSAGSFSKRSSRSGSGKPDDLGSAKRDSARSRSTASKTWRIRIPGVVMLGGFLRDTAEARMSTGLDPINVMRDPSANKADPDGRREYRSVAGGSCRTAYSEDSEQRRMAGRGGAGRG